MAWRRIVAKPLPMRLAGMMTASRTGLMTDVPPGMLLWQVQVARITMARETRLRRPASSVVDPAVCLSNW